MGERKLGAKPVPSITVASSRHGCGQARERKGEKKERVEKKKGDKMPHC